MFNGVTREWEHDVEQHGNTGHNQVFLNIGETYHAWIMVQVRTLTLLLHGMLPDMQHEQLVFPDHSAPTKSPPMAHALALLLVLLLSGAQPVHSCSEGVMHCLRAPSLPTKHARTLTWHSNSQTPAAG